MFSFGDRGDVASVNGASVVSLTSPAALSAGDHALAAADPQLAEALAVRALAADPWSERTQRMVIEARLVSGDQDGARRAAERAVAVLDDLGASPGPDTVALLRRVGSPGRLAGAADRPREAVSPTTAAPGGARGRARR
jgi:DNA-binding SARP family transcriptional activator